MNNPVWYLLLGILFVVSIATRYQLLLFFSVLMALASFASSLWMRYCLAAVSYRRKLGSTHLPYGEETELTIDVVNAKPLPLAWLQVLDTFPAEVTMLTRMRENDDGPMPYLINVMAMGWYERVRRAYHIKGDKRGRFEFGPADISSGDIFGFYWRSKTEAHVDRLIVYPRVVPVTQLGFTAAWPLVEYKTPYRLLDDPLRMASVREYVPGDSHRHIHWKATARLGKLQTKVFDPGASHVLLLFTDVQTNVNPYSLEPEHLELVITASASIALHALNSKQGVGLYANGGIDNSRRYAKISPSRNPAQASRVLEALACLDAFRQMSMGKLLYSEMATLPYGSSVVVITAMPGDELYKALLRVQANGHPVTLLTVGEEPIKAPTGIKAHYLGGRDAWRRLEKIELA